MQEKVLERLELLFIKHLLHDFEEVSAEDRLRVFVKVEELTEGVNQGVVVFGDNRRLSLFNGLVFVCFGCLAALLLNLDLIISISSSGTLAFLTFCRLFRLFTVIFVV